MSKVVLEGMNRLPGKLQDLILDTGMAVSHTQTSSASNETLASMIKNYASLDNSIENIQKNLDKMDSEVEKLDKKIDYITDAQHKFMTMEVNNYYCKKGKDDS